jgi:hypothetical protein
VGSDKIDGDQTTQGDTGFTRFGPLVG